MSDRNEIKYTTFGCPKEAMDRIAEALGMTGEQLARSGLDLEVLDSARWLADEGIKVETVEQVMASGKMLCDESKYPGFANAVLIAAKNLEMSVEDF